MTQQNRTKSIFISFMISTAVLFTFFSIWQMVQNGFLLGWVGLFIASFTVVAYFANLYRFKTARTTERLTNYSAPVFIGTVVTFLGLWQTGAETGLATLFSVVMLIEWSVYVNWYSKLKRPLNPKLVVGRELPSFSLQDENGEQISTATFRGQKVMFMFYRGNWCPFCVAQIKEVAANYQELAQRGVQIVLISPQSQKHTANLAQRFAVPMQFLIDSDNQVARQLGIAHEHGVPMGLEVLGYESETVLPTVLILDENGRIIYVNLTENYRIRPEPAEYMRVLDGLAVA